MSAPAGPCEWCGGPQRWTVIRGELYVTCELGCLPLPLEEFSAPPPDGKELEAAAERAELFEEGDGVPREGGADRTSGTLDPELPW